MEKFELDPRLREEIRARVLGEGFMKIVQSVRRGGKIMWGQAPELGFEMVTFLTFLARYGTGGGTSPRRRMPKGALMSGFEKPPRRTSRREREGRFCGPQSGLFVSHCAIGESGRV